MHFDRWDSSRITENQKGILSWTENIDQLEPMPRTRTPTAFFLAVLAFGVTLVQSSPVPLSEEKLNPVDCLPYTRWDPSAERCVGCTNQCPPGKELTEDCGYNKEGYPVAEACRQCPNGTYSENRGQERCRGCKTCLNGYEQECDPKQPAVCLCADDEELAPDGTTCQKICCLCQSDPPSNWDVINDCVYRYPATPQYRCKKNSWSAGETCMQPPQPTATVSPPPVSTPDPPPPQTTVNTNVSIPTPGNTNTSKATPPGPTFPASSEPSTTSHSPSEPTTKGNHTGTSSPLPIQGNQQLPWFVFVIIGVCALIGIGICCWNREKIAAYLSKDVGFDRLRGDESEEEEDEEGKGGGEEEEEEEGKGGEGGGGGGKLSEVIKDAGQDEEVDNSGGADSGNVSKESSDAGSDKRDSQCSSKDSLLDSEGGQEDSTQERACSVDGENLDNETEKTTPKEVGSEETMDFVERVEGPPNDEKGLNAVPFGGGPNRGNQQQPRGGPPPPYTGPQRQDGQPAVSISGGTFNAPVTIVVQGNDSQYHAAHGMDSQGQGAQNRRRGDRNPANGAAPRQADGMRQHPAQPDMGGQRGGDGAGPNNAPGQGNQRAATVTQNDRLAHPPGNGNDRVGNRRRQDIQVNILPNPARLGQDVRFSCALPADIDANTCEFRWTKHGQVDCVAQVQNWNRTVQRCDAGVYTCEVTTAGGEVLDGQAELVITEDNAGGGVDLPGPSHRSRDNDDDQPTRKRPRFVGPGTSGAQGFSNSSGQIQVPDFIQQKPLEAILNEEDLFYDLRIKLEQSDGHFRNIGSHFGLTHDELNHIEFTELRGKDSPLKAILEKVTKTNGNVTLGEFLQYCDEKLKRRDVVKLVVDYFVEKEQRNQEPNMEVKEGGVEKTNVVADDLQQLEECSKRDSIDCEMKEVGPKIVAVVIDDVPEESLSDSSVAQKKLGTCDYNPETIELVEMQS